MRVSDGRYHDFLETWADSVSCVVAGRLANLDHNLQVLLIEAGETNLNVSQTTYKRWT